MNGGGYWFRIKSLASTQRIVIVIGIQFATYLLTSEMYLSKIRFLSTGFWK